MNRLNRLAILAAIVLLLVAVAAWQLRSIDHPASGQQMRTFVVDCPFDKFRQIMVRKSATKAIVSNSGMKLLDERTLDIDLDASQDERPILNAIRGQSKTDVKAVKELTVQLDDPMLEASELNLRQDVNIQEGLIQVSTVSKRPAGRLESYQTTLEAEPEEQGTRVKLGVQMDVRVKVPKFFRYRADQGVQQAAEDAVAGQESSIKEFIDLYADELFIIPDLKR
jgi:hypothetical protein